MKSAHEGRAGAGSFRGNIRNLLSPEAVERGAGILLNSRRERSPGIGQEEESTSGFFLFFFFFQILLIQCKQLIKRAGTGYVCVVSLARCGSLPSSSVAHVQLRSMPSLVIYLWNYIALPQVTFYFYFISSPRFLQWEQKLFPHRQLPFDTHSYKWKGGWGKISMACGRRLHKERRNYSLKVHISIGFSFYLETWEVNPRGHLLITQWNQ